MLKKLALLIISITLCVCLFSQEKPEQHKKNKLSGTIYFKSDKDPVVGGIVKIKDTNIATLSNSDGKFTLVIPEVYMQKKLIQFEFSATGKKTVSLTYLTTKIPVDKKFYLENEHILTGEITISEQEFFPDPIYDKPVKQPKRNKNR